MPLQPDPLGQRFDFRGLLSDRDLELLAAHPSAIRLQFDRPSPSENWPRLEEAVLRQRDDVELRAWGHDPDLGFLVDVPSLRHLWVGDVRSASGLDRLVELPYLESLFVGIDDLVTFDFLDAVPKSLSKLFLGPTRSKKPSLDPVARLDSLLELGVCTARGIEALSSLVGLRELRLIHLSGIPLAFLKSLSQLEALEVSLGGTLELDSIAELPRLRTLELDWIRGVSDLSFIARCSPLRRLILSRLPRVGRLPDLSRLHQLRHLGLGKMKGLESLDEIGSAPSLEYLGFSDAAQFEPSDFEQALQAPRLKRIGIGLSSRAKELALERMALARGIQI